MATIGVHRRITTPSTNQLQIEKMVRANVDFMRWNGTPAPTSCWSGLRPRGCPAPC